MKSKKLIFKLGAISVGFLPMLAIVSCGQKSHTQTVQEMVSENLIKIHNPEGNKDNSKVIVTMNLDYTWNRLGNDWTIKINKSLPKGYRWVLESYVAPNGQTAPGSVVSYGYAFKSDNTLTFTDDLTHVHESRNTPRHFDALPFEVSIEHSDGTPLDYSAFEKMLPQQQDINRMTAFIGYPSRAIDKGSSWPQSYTQDDFRNMKQSSDIHIKIKQ